MLVNTLWIKQCSQEVYSTYFLPLFSYGGDGGGGACVRARACVYVCVCVCVWAKLFWPEQKSQHTASFSLLLIFDTHRKRKTTTGSIQSEQLRRPNAQYCRYIRSFRHCQTMQTQQIIQIQPVHANTAIPCRYSQTMQIQPDHSDTDTPRPRRHNETMRTHPHHADTSRPCRHRRSLTPSLPCIHERLNAGQ